MNKQKKILINITAALIILVTMNSIISAEEASENNYRDLVKYDFGKSLDDLYAVERDVRSAKPEEHAEIETKLLTVLNSSGASAGCKDFICRMLRWVGSEKSIPSLEKLLYHEKLSHMACFALERLSGPKVDALLLKALKKTKGNIRIGLINVAGERRIIGAAGEIVKLISLKDEATSRAAVSALGRIGTKNAADLLKSVKLSKALETPRLHALLQCADNLLSMKKKSDAANIYNDLLSKKYPVIIRSAALVGIARAKKNAAIKDVIIMLGEKERTLQNAALRAFLEISGSKVVKAFCSKLSKADPEMQVLMLNTLSRRKDRTADSILQEQDFTDLALQEQDFADSALPYVIKLANSKNKEVRIAAIRALGSLGDSSCVDLLINAGEEEASESLCRLQGKGVFEKLIKLLKKADADQKQVIIEALFCRGEKKSLPYLLKMAYDKDKKVRKAVYKGLGVMAGEKEMKPILDMLLKNPDRSERFFLKKIICSIAPRLSEAGRGKNADMIINSFNKADDSVKADLLGIMAEFGGNRAYNTVMENTKNKNKNIKIASIKALAEWKNTRPIPALLNIAKNEKDIVCHVIALRGVIDMIKNAPEIKNKKAVSMLEQAMRLARRTEEKLAVLGALPNFKCDAAKKFVKKYLNDPNLKNEAKAALKKLEGKRKDKKKKSSRKKDKK